MEMYSHHAFHHDHQQGVGSPVGGRVPAAASAAAGTESNGSAEGSSTGNHHHNYSNGTKRPRPSGTIMATAPTPASRSNKNYATGNAAGYYSPSNPHTVPQQQQEQQHRMSYLHQLQQHQQPQQDYHQNGLSEEVYGLYRNAIQQQLQLADQHRQQQYHQRINNQQQQYHQHINNRPQERIAGKLSSKSSTASPRTSGTDFLLHIEETDPAFQLEAGRKEAPTLLDKQRNCVNNNSNNNTIPIQNSTTHSSSSYKQGGTHHRTQKAHGGDLDQDRKKDIDDDDMSISSSDSACKEVCGNQSSSSSNRISTRIMQSGSHASLPATSVAFDTGRGGKSAQSSSAPSTANLNDSMRDVDMDDGDYGIDDAGNWDPHFDQEEQKLLQEMLNDIQEDENLNLSAQLPSKARNVVDASTSSMNDSHDDSKSWQTQLPLKPAKGREGETENEDNDISPSNRVSRVEDVQHVETNVPNRIRGTNNVLFTPAQFHTYVLNKVERTFDDSMDAGKEWAARIVENHPNNPHGYVLEARGPPPLLHVLRQETQSFLTSVRARLAKDRIVMKDEESLFVDIPVGRTEKPGIVLEEDNYTGDFAASSNGVWVKKLKSKKTVASALGMTRTKGREMLVTAVNDTFVSSKKAFTQAIQRARNDESNNTYTITICLSKSFDYDSASGLSSLNARYRNGTVFDDELHLALKRQQRLSETMIDDAPCYLEYLPDTPFYKRPILPRKPPTTKKEVSAAFDEITSNENSVEVDLALQANKKFGATIHNCNDGVYLTDISPDGLVGTALKEEASKYGCVLLKVGCIKVQTKEDLEEPDLVEDTPDGKMWRGIRVTIGLFDGTNLSQIDTNCLVQRKPNPRRSNKQPYALHPWPKDHANEGDSSSDSVPRKENQSLNEKEDDSKEGDVLVEDDISELTGSDGDTVEIERKRGLETSRDSERPSKSSRLLTWSGSNDSSEKLGEDQKSKFIRFEKKYGHLSKLDFNDTKIHAKKRISSLWNQHKKLKGEDADCVDSCDCVHQMAFLGATVLRDHVVDSGMDLKKLLSLSCGIFASFGPKFIPLLRIEYPQETPAQLLSRLSDMWKIHRANLRFSSPCKEGCDCLGEWDGAFGKGDNEKAKKFRTRPSRALPGAMCPSSDAPSIPRKKNPPRPPNAQSMQYASISGLLAEEAQTNNLRNNHMHRNSIKVAAESFERRIDLKKPNLGAYFFTFRAPSGQTRCRIASINPNGQLAMGKPILKHTSVVGYYMGNTVHDISTHEELRTQYETLRKQKKSQLHLKLDTQGAKNEPALNLNDWDDNGTWIGIRSDGWDGTFSEASTERKEPGAPLTQAQYETVVRDNNLPSPSAEPIKSIIKRKTDNHTNDNSPTKTKKNLKFKDGDSMEEIYHFDMDSPTNVHVVKVTVTPSSVVEHMKTVNGDHITQYQHAYDRLQDAVNNKTVKEVLEVLAGGACADRTVVEHGLNDAKECARKKIESPSCTPSERNDAEAKLKLLKIYLAGSFAIFEALRVTKWHRVEMEIKELELQSEECSRYESNHVSGNIFQHVSKGDVEPQIQLVAKLDRRSQSEFISYDQGFCCFRVYNNLSVTYDERKIQIELEQQVPARTIGSVVFNVDEIERACPKDEQKHIFKHIIQPTGGGPLRSGSLTLEARKKKPEKEYLEKKRKEAEKRLEKVVEDIKRFNSEYKHTLQISGNLRGLDEYSLLHAAVSLGNNSGIVDDLLSLGADPKHKSCDSVTPIKIASSHFEKASEYKVRPSENVGNPKEDEKERENHHNQRCKVAKSIFEKLRNYNPRLENDCQALHSRYSQHGSITDVESRPPAGHERTPNTVASNDPPPQAQGYAAYEPPERRDHLQRSGPEVGGSHSQQHSFGGGNQGRGGLAGDNWSTSNGNRQNPPPNADKTVPWGPNVCWHLRRHGWCRYGSKCRYEHPPELLAGPEGGGRGSSHGGRGGGRGGRGGGRGRKRGSGQGSYVSLAGSSNYYAPPR